MPKRYILKTIGNNNGYGSNPVRPFEKNLFNLSGLGINWDTKLIKQIRTNPESSSFVTDAYGGLGNGMIGNNSFLEYHNRVAGQNDFIAYFDQSYILRRDFLRKFALQPEIDYVVEAVADEVIVNDDMHYFAYPNTRKLSRVLDAEKGKEIIDGINEAYKHVYHKYHFNEGNSAWTMVKKLLVEGFLAFEIVYEDYANGRMAKSIAGMVELDAVKLTPEIRRDEKGHEYKVWIVDEGTDNERELLDSNVIYISWAKSNITSHLSYCERLIKAFNTLMTIENSRIVWNLQNAQKRIKMIVPIGAQAPQMARTRLNELEAYFKEDITIDNVSGEIAVNGQPKFQFAKTFIIPQQDGSSPEISEMGVEGHDLNSTETLKWFWQRFMILTRLPKDRFNMLFDGGTESSAIPDNNNMTKEEYRFMHFIDRIRDLFKEILIKSTWIQFCLYHPEFAKCEFIRNSLGLTWVEDNIFTLAKEQSNLNIGAGIIQTLSGIKKSDGSNMFSGEFLAQKYLNISDDDWALNNKLLEKEMKKTENANTMEGGELGVGNENSGLEMLGGGESGITETPSVEEPKMETPEPVEPETTEIPGI